MSPRVRRTLARAGSFVLAGVLLYLALRGVDLNEVLAALRDANYVWLLPLVVVVLLSHVMRAWRWQVLVEALPESKGYRPTLAAAFSSVMIGYMVNYAAPRLGEVARTANFAKRERLTFSGVFGTVVVERILDMIVLSAALVTVFILLLDRFSTISGVFIEPLTDQVGRIPAMGVGAVILALGILIVIVFRQVRKSSRMRRIWEKRAVPMLISFKEGIMTVLRSRRGGALTLSTLLMWVLYLLMAHIPFVMLGIADTYNVSLLDTWCIMVFGALGIVVPSPGGTGSYHYITIQTLVHLFAVDQTAAATYAVLTHAAQLVLYVAVGAACLLVQATSFSGIRRPEDDAAVDA